MTSIDDRKRELASLHRQVQSDQSRLGELESLLLGSASSDTLILARNVLDESAMSDKKFMEDLKGHQIQKRLV